MTKREFATVMTYVGVALQKKVTTNQLRVYYDLLKDLEPAVFLAAAKAVLAESVYPTLPTPGAFRQAADRLLAGHEVTWPEAWQQVLRVINAPSVLREKLRSEMDPRARRAAECLGWEEIACSTNGGTIRAHYQKAFEAMADRDQRERLVAPAALQVLEGLFALPQLEVEKPAQETLTYERPS